MKNCPSPVRKGTVAKGLHDAVCLRGVISIRSKWSSLYGFQNYENSNKFVKNVKFHNKYEWAILLVSCMRSFIELGWLKSVKMVGILQYLYACMSKNVHKLIATFYRATLVRKCFKIEGTNILTKKQRILFLEQFWHYSKSRKSLTFSNFKIRFSVTYLYCSG